MAVVVIPSLLRDLTHGQARVAVPGATVRQVLQELEAAFPGTRERLCDGDRLKPGLAVAVDAQFARNLLEAVGDHSEVHFIPAVGGGS